MDEKQIKLTVGALLHDVGKVLYRTGDGRNHSVSGYEYLKDNLQVSDKDILDQVHYHHAGLLSSAKIPDDSFAYITYIADNIAAMIDRRDNDLGESGFDKKIPLESIFNILNGNNQRFVYQAKTLNDGINYPQEEVKDYSEGFYNKLSAELEKNIRGMNFNKQYINSLLEIMEAYLTYVPSSTNKKEYADISLYDHVKVTAAFASCIYEYLNYYKIVDYKTELYKNAQQFYDKKVFLMYSMDISGIQDFIYTISTDKALKMLRARSFYLEILMEHIIDELLDELGLSRTNRLYAGGGHCYLVLPNTEQARTMISLFERKLNNWFLEYFKTDLYVAGGFYEFSANEINNNIEGQYRNIFNNISSCIAKKKVNRYSYDQLLKLNEKKTVCGSRECKVCKRTDRLTEGDVCSICNSLIKMSPDLLLRGKNDTKFFCIVDSVEESKGFYLPLPNDKYFTIVDGKDMPAMMKRDCYVRSYCKNEMYQGEGIATKLWVADYTSKDTLEELAKNAEGIERIAVLRADIDDLGQAFVSGFKDKAGKDTHSTISRTATFSRCLSLFFKKNVNEILENGEYTLTKKTGKRQITVVYSGGDDMFVVGSWDEVVGFAVDLYKAVKKYTQGTLTISAGIGMFHDRIPISVMAEQTGRLEELSKKNNNNKKNSITLFNEESIYNWEIFINKVIDEKYKYIKEFFENNEEKGKTFLYKMADYLRNLINNKDKINLARLAYLLGRLEPEGEDDTAKYEAKLSKYKEFKERLYYWLLNNEDSRELLTAIYIYVYTIRDEEEE